jgi:hypothetical protein
MDCGRCFLGMPRIRLRKQPMKERRRLRIGAISLPKGDLRRAIFISRLAATHLGHFVFESALKLGQILLIQRLCFLLQYR